MFAAALYIHEVREQYKSGSARREAVSKLIAPTQLLNIYRLVPIYNIIYIGKLQIYGHRLHAADLLY